MPWGAGSQAVGGKSKTNDALDPTPTSARPKAELPAGLRIHVIGKRYIEARHEQTILSCKPP